MEGQDRGWAHTWLPRENGRDACLLCVHITSWRAVFGPMPSDMLRGSGASVTLRSVRFTGP
eukprot:1169848-Prymnesium_polylepis.1